MTEREVTPVLRKENHFEARKSLHTGHIVSRAMIFPGPVLADRDRRARLAPRDLTAAILGDPLPGYSALDRARRSSDR